MPESLKIFDKILCTNVKTHAETPSTSGSSDPPTVRGGAGKAGDVRRKYDATETRVLLEGSFSFDNRAPFIVFVRLEIWS